MKRAFWLAFGAFAQVLFVATVGRLFPFLRGGGHFRGLLAPAPGASAARLLIDGLLAAQFAAAHSVLLLPSARKALGRWVPSALYGCVFCVATCVGLLLAIEAWQPCAGAFWRLHGPAARLVDLAFLLSWGALLYSLWLTGLGYQTGLTPWWAWARGREVPRRGFEPRGAYRVLRHPVYLSFLGLVWSNPVMTSDRMVLALAWSAHIFVGSYLKDRRLAYYLGEPYRDYQRRVPGYPFLPRGPLGTLRSRPVAEGSTAPGPRMSPPGNPASPPRRAGGYGSVAAPRPDLPRRGPSIGRIGVNRSIEKISSCDR